MRITDGPRNYPRSQGDLVKSQPFRTGRQRYNCNIGRNNVRDEFDSITDLAFVLHRFGSQ